MAVVCCCRAGCSKLLKKAPDATNDQQSQKLEKNLYIFDFELLIGRNRG